jgi:hypothetical protein
MELNKNVDIGFITGSFSYWDWKKKLIGNTDVCKQIFPDTIVRKPEDLSFNEYGLVTWCHLPSSKKGNSLEEVYSGRVYGPISLHTDEFPTGDKGKKDLLFHYCFASFYVLTRTSFYYCDLNCSELINSLYNEDMFFVDGYVMDGLETGKWRFYYVDKLIIEAEFSNGQLNGTCYFYNLDGTMLKTTEFINNKNTKTVSDIQLKGLWSKRNNQKKELIDLIRFPVHRDL